MMFTNHSQISAVDESEVVACDLEGEVALLNLKTETYYSLDPVGAHIWRLLDEPQTVAAIQQTLLQEYEVEPERCRHDLLLLLQQLHEAGLIRVQDNASP